MNNEPQLNLYNLSQTQSQIIQDPDNIADDDKQQLIKQLMNKDSQQQIGQNIRKRMSKLDKEIANNSHGQHLQQYQMQQQHQHSLRSNDSNISGDNLNRSGSQERNQAKNLRDVIKLQNSFNKKSQISQNGVQNGSGQFSDQNSFQNGNNSELNVSHNTHNRQLKHYNQMANQQKFIQQQQESQQNMNIYNNQNQGNNNEIEGQFQFSQDQFQMVDYRGSQRSKELYLKGLKNKIEQQNKIQQIKQARESQEVDKCTFSPDITRQAKNLPNYMDIVQKTEIHYIRKYEREQGRKMEIEDQEQSQCTFIPQFCKKSLMSPSKQGHSQKRIYERSLDWQKEVSEKNQKRDKERWDSICSSHNASITSRRSVSRSKHVKSQSSSVQPRLRRPESSTFYQKNYNHRNSTSQNRSFSNQNNRSSNKITQSLYQSSNNNYLSQSQNIYKNNLQSPKVKIDNSKTVNNKLQKLLQTTDTKQQNMLSEVFNPIKNEISDTLNLFNKIKNSLNQNQQNIQQQQHLQRQNKFEQKQQSQRNHNETSQDNASNKGSIHSHQQSYQNSYKSHRLSSISPDVQTTNTLKPRAAAKYMNQRKQQQYSQQESMIKASKSPPKFSKQNRSQYEQALSPNKVSFQKHGKIGLNNNRYVFRDQNYSQQLNNSGFNNSQLQETQSQKMEDKENSDARQFVTDNQISSQLHEQYSPRSTIHYNLKANNKKVNVDNKKSFNNTQKKQNQQLQDLLKEAYTINQKIRNLAGPQSSGVKQQQFQQQNIDI